jgi:peptide/nickel transport system substrate-binding protein
MGSRLDSDNYWLRNSRMNRRRWLAGATTTTAGAAAFAMVGCGDSDDAASPTAGGGAAGVGAVTPSASPTAEPVGKKGGELRVAMDNDPVSLDPHIESSYRTQWVIGAVYNRLLNLTSDLVIRPELATSWEQPDPTTLTLKLQQGVKFQNVAPVNGRVFNAEDVIWNLTRIATNKPEFQRRYMFEAITGMTAPDANTVQIKLAQPFAPLLGYLANPFNSMAPKEAAADTGDLRTKAIGTGPFLYKEGQKGVAYKLARNPDYWEKDRPYLDAMTVSVVPQIPSRQAGFRAKQLDIEPMD